LGGASLVEAVCGCVQLYGLLNLYSFQRIALLRYSYDKSKARKLASVLQAASARDFLNAGALEAAT